MRRLPYLSFFAVALLIALPHFAHAAVSVSSLLKPIIDPSGQCYCPGAAPDWGCVMQTIQNVLNTFIAVATVLISLFIAQAGFAFILSPTNEEKRTQARARALNAVIGLLIVLASWLIVDSVMKVLYREGSFGPWNSILAPTGGDYCIVKKEPSSLPGISGAANSLGTGTAGSPGADNTGSQGTNNPGTCTVQSSGACNVSNMTAFGSQANQASEICTAESGGNASILSGVDKLGDGTPYSVGLFQINLTSNSVGGLPCPSAFSKQGCTVSSCGAGTGVHVTNPSLYNQCVQAAKDPQTNAAAAQHIYQVGSGSKHNSWDPWGTASKCGLRN